MINFNKINVNIISILISSIIFIVLILIINHPLTENKIEKSNVYTNTINNTQNEIQEENITNWSLEIKSLNIKGPIKEMENETPYDDYIGHFKETSIIGNNIGLIAYNYGSSKNYFANLKDLKPNDEITYVVNDKIKKYQVITNQIIEKISLKEILSDNNNQDKSVLKLFTYVMDLDTKLRYVCAKEIIDI